MAQLEKIRKRAAWSWQGFAHVYRTEGSLHQWLWAFGATIVLMILLPLTSTERAVVLMGGFFVLSLECLNTAVERIVDDISEEWRDRAGQAKDAGSAAVALAGLGVGAAWLCILSRLIFS